VETARSEATTVGQFGALVVWDADSDRHVAIGLGDGTATSGEERSTVGVHDFSLADRYATPDAGGSLSHRLPIGCPQRWAMFCSVRPLLSVGRSAEGEP
jgi:hypothetical protein